MFAVQYFARLDPLTRTSHGRVREAPWRGASGPSDPTSTTFKLAHLTHPQGSARRVPVLREAAADRLCRGLHRSLLVSALAAVQRLAPMQQPRHQLPLACLVHAVAAPANKPATSRHGSLRQEAADTARALVATPPAALRAPTTPSSSTPSSLPRRACGTCLTAPTAALPSSAATFVVVDRLRRPPADHHGGPRASRSRSPRSPRRSRSTARTPALGTVQHGRYDGAPPPRRPASNARGWPGDHGRRHRAGEASRLTVRRRALGSRPEHPRARHGGAPAAPPGRARSASRPRAPARRSR